MPLNSVPYPISHAEIEDIQQVVRTGWLLLASALAAGMSCAKGDNGVPCDADVDLLAKHYDRVVAPTVAALFPTELVPVARPAAVPPMVDT